MNFTLGLTTGLHYRTQEEKGNVRGVIPDNLHVVPRITVLYSHRTCINVNNLLLCVWKYRITPNLEVTQ